MATSSPLLFRPVQHYRAVAPPSKTFVVKTIPPVTTLLLHAELSPAAFHSTDLSSTERETGGQFTLGQNFPNPYADKTTVPFTLTNAADVQLDIFDCLGRKVAGVIRKGLPAGPQTICLNLCGLNLPAGDYIYQLQVSNSYGVYSERKAMTAA